MPDEWHNRHAVNRIEDEQKKEFYRDIVAAKKPYFMRYIYPALMREYNTYITNTNRNSLREFQLTMDELLSLSGDEYTDRQLEFLKYYRLKMPVGVHDCVMNKICRRFEDKFDGYVSKHKSSNPFDYAIMKSDAEYTQRQMTDIRRLYDDYNRRLANYKVFSNYERIDKIDSSFAIYNMDEEFRRECIKACPDKKVLCNIVLDLCYQKASTKRFAWSMCGDVIIENLLEKNNNRISFPVLCEEGDISFGGNKFKLETIEVAKDDYDYFE